jgi:hypothetical protein
MLRICALLGLAAGCSSSMSRADFEKKYAPELNNAREALVAIQQSLDTAPPATVGAACELPGAAVVNASPPYKAGNLEVLSEAQLLHVLDPAREQQLLEHDRARYKPLVQRLVVNGPLRAMVDPNHSMDKVGASELKDVELSRGVTHVLVLRGGPHETQQVFLFDVKQRAPVCSFAVSVEVPADIFEEKVQYDTRRDGVVTNRTHGTTHKREAYFDEHMRLELSNEVKRRFGI